MSRATDLIREIQRSKVDLPASKLATWDVLARRVIELEEIAWLAEDFVVSCDTIPAHPTAGRLVQWIEDRLEDRRSA